MGIQDELKDISSQYDKIVAEAHSLLDGLTDEQFNKRPESNKWSIGECIDHLNKSAGGYLDNVEKVINANSEKKIGSEQSIKFGLIGKFFKKMEPPPVKKYPAPGKLKPSQKLSKDKVLNEFYKQQERIKNYIKQSAGLNVNKLKVPSPVLIIIKIRIGEFFAFTAVHERRHLWQIREILKQISA